MHNVENMLNQGEGSGNMLLLLILDLLFKQLRPIMVNVLITYHLIIIIMDCCEHMHATWWQCWDSDGIHSLKTSRDISKNPD